MRKERMLRWGLASLLFSTAACSAIAGLDGDFALESVGPDGSDDGGRAQTDATANDGQVVSETGTTNDDAGDASDAGQDQNAPDACATRTVLAPDASAGVPATSCSPEVVCWRFAGTNNETAPFGWDTDDTTGGTVGLLGTPDTPARRFVATLVPEAGADSGAALWDRDWDHSPGAPGDTPLSLELGHELHLTFSFKLQEAGRQAELARVQIGTKTYGLAVYPDPCGGDPRVAQSGEDGTKLTLGANVKLGAWYTGEVHYRRTTAGDWSGEVLVGGVSVGTRADIFTKSTSTQVPLAFGIGEIGAGPKGRTEVEIDDILMHDATLP